MIYTCTNCGNEYEINPAIELGKTAKGKPKTMSEAALTARRLNLAAINERRKGKK